MHDCNALLGFILCVVMCNINMICMCFANKVLNEVILMHCNEVTQEEDSQPRQSRLSL